MVGVLWTRPSLNLSLIVEPDGILKAPRTQAVLEIHAAGTTGLAGAPYGDASVCLHPTHPEQQPMPDSCH